MYPWPPQDVPLIIKSMWAPWPGYSVSPSRWRLLLEADGVSTVVHTTKPHELPVVDMRGY